MSTGARAPTLGGTSRGKDADAEDAEGVALRRSGVAGALVAVLLATFAVAIPASASSETASSRDLDNARVAFTDPGLGSLTVSVTAWATGSAANGGCVSIAPAAGGAVVATQCTGTAGTYLLDNVVPGDYAVRAYNFTGLTEMWTGPALNQAAATSVSVAADAETPVAMRMLTSTQVAGRVVDASANPIAGATVQTWNVDARSIGNTSTTAADGWYVIPLCLTTCRLKVSASGLAAEYYPGGGIATSAAALPSTGPLILNSLTLDTVPGALQGTFVALPQTAASTVCIQVLERWASGSISGQRLAETQCGAPGETYTFSGLGATTHYACYVPPPGTTPCQYYSDNVHGSSSSPTPLAITSGETTMMPSFGSIRSVTIKVGSTSSAAATKGCYEAWTDEGAFVAKSCDPPDGVFTLSLLDDTLEYRWFVRGVPGGKDKWVNDEPGSASTTWPIVDGSVTNAGDVLISAQNKISGVITLPAGSIAPSGCVIAWSLSPLTQSAQPKEVCANPANGTYSIPLDPGSYKLEFYADDPHVALQWYGGGQTFAGARTITVTNADLTGVNVSLASGGALAASVEAAGGIPVTEGCLGAYDDTGRFVTSTCLDGATNVVIGGLAPGEYAVSYMGSEDFEPAWLGGDSFESADLVHVIAGADTDVSIEAVRDGAVAVTVRGPGGIGVRGGCVTAFDAASGAQAARECSDDDSGFVEISLNSGEYSLLASGWSTFAGLPLADAWAPHSTAANAETVVVTSGTVASRSISLSASTGIIRVATTYTTEPVRLPQVVPATGGCAYAYTPAGDLAAMSCADADQDVVDLHVAPGEYRILVDGYSSSRYQYPLDLSPLWSAAATHFDAATPVQASSGIVTALTIRIPRGIGVLRGAVTLGGVPVNGGTVEFYSSDGELIATAPINTWGEYSLTGLVTGATGILKVRDVPGAADQYYGGAVGSARAVPVSVPKGDGAVNVQLAQSGSLSGVLHTTWATGVGEEICAKVWITPNEYTSTDTYPAYYTWELVDQYCGQLGDTFLFPHLVAGKSYTVTFEDSSGRSEWDQGQGLLHTAAKNHIYAGQEHVLWQPPYYVSGPEEFAWGETVTFVVTQLHPVDGPVSGEIYEARHPETSRRAVTLNFVNGHAEYVFPLLHGNWNVTETGVYFESSLGGSRGQQLTVVPPAVTAVAPPRGWPGTDVRVDVSLSPVRTGVAILWVFENGTWNPTTNVFSVQEGTGTTTIRVASTSKSYAVAFEDGVSNVFTVDPVTPTVTRIGGPTRYEVAVGISQQYFPDGADVVYLATGGNFPDALGAAPAAALQDAPLLLVEPGAIPAAVKAELARLDPDQIIVTGGPASVSDAVLTQLHEYASIVKRINGPDRYEVSRSVTWDAFKNENPDIAYIATGATFPDALSASAAAGFVDAPVILLDGVQPTLDSATRQLLLDLGVNEIRIAGGPGSVSPGIETALRNVPGVTSVTRLSGADRFVVSGATNRAAFTHSDIVFIASGYTFPDALAGAPVAGALGAPLYVIPTSCIPNYVLEDIANLGATEVRILGGPGSVTPEAAALRRC